MSSIDRVLKCMRRWTLHAVADVWLKNIGSGFEFCKLTAAQNTKNFLFSGLCLGFSMRCLYCDQRMWIRSFHGAYHRDCHFYHFDIVSGFGPRLCSSRWGDICLFEKWQSSAKNAANFRVSTKTCPAYQFLSKSEKTVVILWNIVFYWKISLQVSFWHWETFSDFVSRILL